MSASLSPSVELQPAAGFPVALAVGCLFALVLGLFSVLLLRKLSVEAPEGANAWVLGVFGGVLGLAALVLIVLAGKGLLSRALSQPVHVEVSAAQLHPGDVLEAKVQVPARLGDSARLALVGIQTYEYTSGGELQSDDRETHTLPLTDTARAPGLVQGRVQLPADAPATEKGRMRWALRLTGNVAFVQVDEEFPLEVRAR